jgi:hypothetical protein
MNLMFKVKGYKKPQPVKIHLFLVSFLLIFISLFGFTLSSAFTSYIKADPNGAIRGQAYDLWADKVLGKRDFIEIVPREVFPNKVSSPGGVIVDRSTTPGKAYIWDSGNSRILGIDLADCYALDPNTRCEAEIIIGQPSGNDYGACNLDSSFQFYPNRAPASASTICGIPEWTHTTLEDKSFTSMFVDANSNLYVADVLNHRVLKFNNPFATDVIADEVWGQDNFTGNLCNKTKTYLATSTPQPTASSLCFLAIGNGGAGVTLDSSGNLWVADGGNSRVLRFPFVNGSIAKTADIVIGQANFIIGGDNSGGSTNNRLSSVTAVRFDSLGRLYVADTGNNRLMRYTSPFSTGMSGTPIMNSSNFPDGLVSIEMDQTNDHIFTYENDGPGSKVTKLDLNLNSIGSFQNWNPGGGSLGIDTAGDVIISAYVYQQDVAVYTDDGLGNFTAGKSFFSPPGSYNLDSNKRLAQGGWGGLSIIGNQLVIADGRLLFWNNPTELANGAPFSGFVGGGTVTDFPNPIYSVITNDKNNRIYVVKGTDIHVYQAPLTNSSTPIATFGPTYTGVNNETISVLNTISGLAVTDNSEYLWISNADNNRIFRVKDPLTNPKVDIVIGQTNANGTTCNKGLVPAPNINGSVSADRTMLCRPGELSLDKLGNLYISDHFFEAEGNWRILMFDNNLFPSAPSSILFNVAATKEFPRLNSVTNFAPANFEITFDSENRMVTGYNPYFGPRFIEVYNTPTSVNTANRSDSNFAVANGRFKDFYGWPFAMSFDSNDNLYVYDSNRGKVLFYKDPLGTPPAPPPSGGGGGSNNSGSANSGNFGSSSGGTTESGSNATSTTPARNIPVQQQEPVSYSNEFWPEDKTTFEALNASGQSNVNILNGLVNVVAELAKHSQSLAALNFAALSAGVFLLITAIGLSLSNASIFGLLPLIASSLLNRKPKYGGIVYNLLTSSAVPFAKVTVFRKVEGGVNSVMEVVEYCLTDLEGRYVLNSLPSKNLSIEVRSVGFEYFFKTLSSNLDIPLKPIKVNVATSIFTVNKNSLLNILRSFTVAASIWGYVTTIYNQVANPSPTNLILIGIYSVMFILAAYPTLYSLFLKRIYILDSQGKKLPGVVVRVFQENNLIDIDLANKKGATQFNLHEGIYRVVSSKQGFAYNETEIEIGEENKVKNQITMQPTSKVEEITVDQDLHDKVIQNNHSKFNVTNVSS